MSYKNRLAPLNHKGLVMKKLLTVTKGDQLSFASLRTAFVFLVALALAATFWMATAPVAVAVQMTPKQMIEVELPQGKVLMMAKKPELAAAVCAAIKRNREAGPQIVRTAVTARPEWTKRIVETAIHCLGSEDCDAVAEIVSVGMTTDPDEASDLIDLALKLAPDCHGAIDAAGRSDGKTVLNDGKTVLPPGEGPAETGNYTNPPTNQNPPPGSIGGGGGFNPQDNRVTVCNNGTEVRIRASNLAKYLSKHPGAHLGACGVTPRTNR